MARFWSFVWVDWSFAANSAKYLSTLAKGYRSMWDSRESNLSVSKGKTTTTTFPTTPTLFTMHQLIWKLKFGSTLDFIRRWAFRQNLALYKLRRTAVKYSCSTKNLKTHLVRRHGENYAANKESAGANISKVTANTSKFMQDNDMAKDFFQPQLNHSSTLSKVITSSIARLIVKDLQLYSVVESDGFQDMVNMFEPSYKIPSRQHFIDK